LCDSLADNEKLPGGCLFPRSLPHVHREQRTRAVENGTKVRHQRCQHDC